MEKIECSLSIMDNKILFKWDIWGERQKEHRAQIYIILNQYHIQWWNMKYNHICGRTNLFFTSAFCIDISALLRLMSQILLFIFFDFYIILFWIFFFILIIQVSECCLNFWYTFFWWSSSNSTHCVSYLLVQESKA